MAESKIITLCYLLATGEGVVKQTIYTDYLSYIIWRRARISVNVHIKHEGKWIEIKRERSH